MNRILLGLGALVPVAAAGGLAAAIGLDRPHPPPVLHSVAAPFSRMEFRTLPPLRRAMARDGTTLAYRLYPGAGPDLAVLVHGSSGPGASMHALATALAAAGVSAVAPDIRGHGESGRRGDIDYVGQLEDDLADLVAALGARPSGGRRVLVGFSSGGGFALRFGAGPQGALFDDYVLVSPAFPGGPAMRADGGGWYDLALPRLVAITLLARLGVHRFEGLPVIAFAVPHDNHAHQTAEYSWRLLMNFDARPDYAADLRALARPPAILVGAADELLVPERFLDTVRPIRPKMRLDVLPGIGHAEMIARPEGLAAIVAAVRGTGGRP